MLWGVYHKKEGVVELVAPVRRDGRDFCRRFDK